MSTVKLKKNLYLISYEIFRQEILKNTRCLVLNLLAKHVQLIIQPLKEIHQATELFLFLLTNSEMYHEDGAKMATGRNC